MVSGSAKQKVPGGKLIYVRLRFGDSIEKIEILGDFFMHPEDKLAEIEKNIVGTSINEDEKDISAIIAKSAKANGIEMIGVTPEAIASTIKMAIRNGMESNSA